MIFDQTLDFELETHDPEDILLLLRGSRYHYYRLTPLLKQLLSPGIEPEKF